MLLALLAFLPVGSIVTHLTGGNLLLVRRFVDCVGNLGCSGHLLACAALVRRLHHSFCSRVRLHGQLAEKSLVSLRDERTAFPHRRDSLPARQLGHCSRERQFGMGTALRRNLRRVLFGMEIREAFRFSSFVTLPGRLLFGRDLGFFRCRRDGLNVVLLDQIIQSYEIFRLNLTPSR